jgi:hypothetical protein
MLLIIGPRSAKSQALNVQTVVHGREPRGTYRPTMD